MTLPTAIDRVRKQPDKIATLKYDFIRLYSHHQQNYGGSNDKQGKIYQQYSAGIKRMQAMVMVQDLP